VPGAVLCRLCLCRASSADGWDIEGLGIEDLGIEDLGTGGQTLDVAMGMQRSGGHEPVTSSGRREAQTTSHPSPRDLEGAGYTRHLPTNR
jgi:hypothetical protein